MVQQWPATLTSADSGTGVGVQVREHASSPMRQWRRTWVAETNEANLRPWRALVTAAAAQARGEVLVGPVAVKVIFTLKRPAGLPARHRGADGVLRPYRPLPAKRPDLDTLCRAVLDALSDAGVWADDGQVVELRAAKLYVGDDDALDAPGARIEVHLVAGSALDAPGPSAEALLQAAEAR